MSQDILIEYYATRPVPVTQSPRSDRFGNVIACFIPMLMFIEIKLVGRLFVSEILLFVMLPFLLKRRGLLLINPLPKKIILLGLAWLLAQVLTDVIRATPFEDWIRGWSKIVFLLLNFSAIYLFLNGKEKRFFWFSVGIALGEILAYLFIGNIYSEETPWKFGYGSAITLLAILATQTKAFNGKRLSTVVIITSMGALNFYMGFRSLGLICLLAAGTILVMQSNRFDPKNVKPSKIAILLVLSFVAIYGISALYDYGASEGWLGDEAREKYLHQSSGDLGVILGGRSEMLASIRAIIDSPVIGHGSWAKDWNYVDILTNALQQHGYGIEGEYESGLIPSHSYIMGAWVEAGFIGAFFWVWILILTARALIANHVANSTMAPLIAFVGFNLLWNIPFSPFGAVARLYVAYDLSLMIYALTLVNPAMAKRAAT